jgi:hypothetical protein
LSPERQVGKFAFHRNQKAGQMSLGTKNRQKQTAETCKQHLREKYRDRLQLVEEFIVEKAKLVPGPHHQISGFFDGYAPWPTSGP